MTRENADMQKADILRSIQRRSTRGTVRKQQFLFFLRQILKSYVLATILNFVKSLSTEPQASANSLRLSTTVSRTLSLRLAARPTKGDIALLVLFFSWGWSRDSLCRHRNGQRCRDCEFGASSVCRCQGREPACKDYASVSLRCILIYPRLLTCIKLRDSKPITSETREGIAIAVKLVAVSLGIGLASQSNSCGLPKIRARISWLLDKTDRILVSNITAGNSSLSDLRVVLWDIPTKCSFSRLRN